MLKGHFTYTHSCTILPTMPNDVRDICTNMETGIVEEIPTYVEFGGDHNFDKWLQEIILFLLEWVRLLVVRPFS
jgi:hypothetical protein